MKIKRALLLGSYGQTNIGDDILMYCFLAYLKNLGYSEIITNVNVIENVPNYIRKKFPQLTFLPTYSTSLLTWIKTIASVNGVFYGGGTIFKELYSTTGRSRYAVITRIALYNLACTLLGKRVIHLNIGIGSLKTYRGRLITKLSLLFCSLSVFRDEQSYLFARDELKIPAQKICLSTDAIFLENTWKKVNEPTTLLRNISANRNKIVGVNFLHDVPDAIDLGEYIEKACKFTDLLSSQGHHVYFVPFQYSFNLNNDYSFIKSQILPKIQNNGQITLLDRIPIEEINSLYKKFDFFIGMRFHALLLSTLNNIPFLAIEYDTKCSRFIKENNYKYSIKLENFTPDEAFFKFQQLENDSFNLKNVLVNMLNKQEAKSKLCLEKVH